jgi:hypothetical protein
MDSIYKTAWLGVGFDWDEIYLHTPLLCDGCCDVLDFHGNSFSVFDTVLEYFCTEDMTQCCLSALDQGTMDIRDTEFGLVGIDDTPKETS